MEKRKRVASLKEASKCRDKQSSIDLISMLGDDVLVSILSRLTFKEAIATSILSRRWRYLWTFMPKLDFDGTKLLLKMMSGKRKRELLDNERDSYVRCVDRGLSSQDSDIEEFRVFFNLTKTHKSSISEWVRYALDRKVQRLALDLTDYGSRSSRKYDQCYTFPYELLRKCGSIDFKYLKKLSMNYVNVDGEALVFFLSNCPLLEDLSVSQSGDLKSLEIAGPFPSFKRLSICFCQNLNSVEIRDTNFVSFKYEGSRINMLLKNVPQLVEIFVGGTLTDNMGDVIFMFSSCLPQLEILTIQKMDHFGWMETQIFHSMVEMSNLKQLVVKVDRYLFGDRSLLPITNLIHASPCLQKFVLEVLRLEPEYVKKKVNQIAGSYPHLKEVEFVGYYGLNSELELVMHFLENAAALENIIINPRKPCDSPFGPRPYATPYGYKWKYYPKFKEDFISEEMSARTRAKKPLMKKVPPGINLKIL